MELTESMLYWTLKLDDIRSSVGILFVSIACILVESIFTWFLIVSDKDLEYVREKVCRIIIACIVMLIITGPTYTFLPNTKQYAAIKIIPVIANSEFVSEELPNEMKEFYHMGKDQIKKQLGVEKTTEPPKSMDGSVLDEG